MRLGKSPEQTECFKQANFYDEKCLTAAIKNTSAMTVAIQTLSLILWFQIYSNK